MQISANTTSPTAPARPAGPAQERTPLQKHVDFFDRNHDHQTTLLETYSGLRAMGVGRLKSALGATFINGALARKTGAPWNHPFTIQNDNIHLAKHDSDTGVYDEKGMFVPARFEALFANNDTNRDGVLSKTEIDAMVARNKQSFAGNLGSKAEFGLLMDVAGQDRAVDGQETRVLTRERLQSFYDGSLFYQLAGEPTP